MAADGCFAYCCGRLSKFTRVQVVVPRSSLCLLRLSLLRCVYSLVHVRLARRLKRGHDHLWPMTKVHRNLLKAPSELEQLIFHHCWTPKLHGSLMPSSVERVRQRHESGVRHWGPSARNIRPSPRPFLLPATIQGRPILMAKLEHCDAR